MGKRLFVAGLACLLVFTGLAPGGTPVAHALVIAEWAQTIDTSVWSPNAPGPSGVAWRPETGTLIVVDTDKGEEPAWDGTNMWEVNPLTGEILYTVALDTDGEDATGISYDPGSQTLFVSNDGPLSGISMFQTSGTDDFTGTRVGFIDTAAILAAQMPPVDPDTEDPALVSTSSLYFLNGATSQVFHVTPGPDMDWGTGDEILDPTAPVIAIPGGGVAPLDDWEGLAYDGTNLLIGAKDDPTIQVVSTTGVLVDTIDVSVLESHGIWGGVSGLGVQPANGPQIPQTIWVADRGDSSPPTTNDGKLHRVVAGSIPMQTPSAPVLQPPLDVPLATSTNEGVLATFDANASDTNLGDTLVFSLTGAPPGASINPASGVFSWTPTEAQGPGTYVFTLRVTDSDALQDTQSVTITVNEVNQAPVVLPNPDILRGEGETVSLTMHATDSDLPAQTITWSASGLPSSLSVNPSTGVIGGTIAAGTTAGSPYSVTVTATDNGPGLLQGSDTFLLSVTDTNRSPVLNPIGNKTVARGSLLAFKANATDPDGDALTFSLVSPPAGAAITAAGNFTWTPNVAAGVYNVTVRVTDNGTPVLTDQETINVTVLATDPNPFIDDDGSVFENSIEWLAAEGITSGCNPPVNNRFCPNDHVTRGQMAAFLVRAKGYSAIARDFFVDDSGSVFENAINRLATAAVTQGCNPPVNDRYCPDGLVTRGQMAAFLVRAFDLPAYSGPDRFVDDDGIVFEGAIERLAQAGITVGCNPPVNDRYCPSDLVTRGQMAAFLKRALGG